MITISPIPRGTDVMFLPHGTVRFVLPGRQCVSLSIVVAMFLCCIRHCFSSSIELVSQKVKVKEELESSHETSPDGSVFLPIRSVVVLQIHAFFIVLFFFSFEGQRKHTTEPK